MSFTTRREANEHTVTLRVKGLPALIVLIALPLGLLWLSHGRYASACDNIHAARECLQVVFEAQYINENLPSGDATPSKAQLRALGEAFTKPGFVIESLELRGRLFGDVVAKAVISVNGHPPSDGETVRYYQMRYSRIIGYSPLPVRGGETAWKFAIWR